MNTILSFPKTTEVKIEGTHFNIEKKIYNVTTKTLTAIS